MFRISEYYSGFRYSHEYSTKSISLIQAKASADSPAAVSVQPFNSAAFALCTVGSVQRIWKKQSAAGERLRCDLKESDGISYRDEQMLLSSVRRLSE